jgi:SPP1 family predicted phage head-tail adaptor
MIQAGLLNKFITVEHLHIVRDEYGSDIEKWESVFCVRANVKGFDAKSLMASSAEIYDQYNLIFTVRKICTPDVHNHYRVGYDGKYFKVLGINQEDRDNTVIMGMLINS